MTAPDRCRWSRSCGPSTPGIPTGDGKVAHVWLAVREQVIGLLRCGRVEALSLDFDLGFRGEEERRTGEVVLQLIEERVFLGDADFDLPEITIRDRQAQGMRGRCCSRIGAIAHGLSSPHLALSRRCDPPTETR